MFSIRATIGASADSRRSVSATRLARSYPGSGRCHSKVLSAHGSSGAPTPVVNGWQIKGGPAEAVDASAKGGRPMRVLYHSHIDVGAYFSETDAAAATMGGDKPSYDGLRYLVTSIRAGVVDDHKLFAWDAEGKAFVEVPLQVVTD